MPSLTVSLQLIYDELNSTSFGVRLASETNDKLIRGMLSHKQYSRGSLRLTNMSVSVGALYCLICT